MLQTISKQAIECQLKTQSPAMFVSRVSEPSFQILRGLRAANAKLYDKNSQVVEELVIMNRDNLRIRIQTLVNTSIYD